MQARDNIFNNKLNLTKRIRSSIKLHLSSSSCQILMNNLNRSFKIKKKTINLFLKKYKKVRKRKIKLKMN